MFLPYQLQHWVGTAYNQTCLDFKLIHSVSTHCFAHQSCRLTFWNCFWVEIINNKTTEVHFTFPPENLTSIFTCPCAKFTPLGQSDLCFSCSEIRVAIICVRFLIDEYWLHLVRYCTQAFRSLLAKYVGYVNRICVFSAMSPTTRQIRIEMCYYVTSDWTWDILFNCEQTTLYSFLMYYYRYPFYIVFTHICLSVFDHFVMTFVLNKVSLPFDSS